MRYRKEIDGIRALAVLLVVLFHADFPLLSGGYIGVDIFFVLSGFLITNVIMADLELNRFSFTNFYIRRTRRILPALLVVVVITLFLGYFLFPPIQFQSLGQAALAASTFVANIYYSIKGGDYFSQEVYFPLLHTWSLAVEEQFYIIFPFIFVVIFRKFPKILFACFITLSLASLAFSEIGYKNNFSQNFYSSLSRAWELLTGVLLALFLNKRSVSSSNLFSVLGIGLILLSAFIYTPTTPFPSFHTLLPIAGTVLILTFTNSTNFLGTILSYPAVAGLGKISYSVYLWHQPVFTFTEYYLIPPHDFLSFIYQFILILTLSTVTYRYVEMPCRNNAAINKHKISFSLSLLALASIIAMTGYGIHHKHGLLNRNNLSGLPGNYYSAAGKAQRFNVGINGQDCANMCLAYKSEGHDDFFILAGDSHANDFRAEAIKFSKEQASDLHLIIGPNCNSQLNCLEQKMQKVKSESHLTSPDLAIFVMAFGANSYEEDTEKFKIYLNGIEYLLSKGTRVLLFSPRIILTQDPVRLALAGKLHNISSLPDFSLTQAWIEGIKILANYENFTLINQNELIRHYARNGLIDITEFDGHDLSGLPLYRDTSHLTLNGASLLFNRLRVILNI